MKIYTLIYNLYEINNFLLLSILIFLKINKVWDGNIDRELRIGRYQEWDEEERLREIKGEGKEER